MPAKSGGGINMNKVTHVRSPKVEPTSHAVSQGAVSRLGNMVGVGTPHRSLYNFTKTSSPFGATDNTAQGPGANRVVMKSGSQGQHGSAVSGTARPGANRPIFPGFK
jgi:hypothetical protein